MYHPPARLILASASPRRRELLTRAGYAFDVVPANIDERRLDGETPRDFVIRTALAKADAVLTRIANDRVVLGADTVVVVNEKIFGKPRNPKDAACMLRQLSGRSHKVLTGVALVCRSARRTAVETTRVTLVKLDDAVVDWYVATGETTDKAGAYGVQGIASRFVERVEGSYTNVVGLPVAVFDRLLRELESVV